MKTEADKLRNSIQYGLGVMDAGSGEFKELSDKIDELFELSYLEGQSSSKIKQLEWDFYGTYYSAKTPVASYLITQEGEFIENYDDCALWVNASLILRGTHEEAKSAAQTDFEKRVKECLL